MNHPIYLSPPFALLHHDHPLSSYSSILITHPSNLHSLHSFASHIPSASFHSHPPFPPCYSISPQDRPHAISLGAIPTPKPSLSPIFSLYFLIHSP